MRAAVIDTHAHAFPDALAPRAVPHLARRARIEARLNGTVGALLASLDRAGIAAAVVCSVATDPAQVPAILRWSRAIASERILPFPSVHPGARDAAAAVRQVAAAGFRGVKLHPEYQEFFVDDPGLADLYGALASAGLVALLHAGNDIGYPDSDRAAPARILAVHRAYPDLSLVAAHLGGYRRWEEAADRLVGTGVYLDTSYSVGHAPEALLRAILLAHRPDRLLFGSDSPWTDQLEALDAIRGLRLPPEREAAILGENARTLLRLGSPGQDPLRARAPGG